MTVEEYFEEWWTPKELPKDGFNKTAMLDFAEMYHKQALHKHDVVGQSEQLPSCDKCGYYIHPENKTCLREGCENY